MGGMAEELRAVENLRSIKKVYAHSVALVRMAIWRVGFSGGGGREPVREHTERKYRGRHYGNIL